MTFTHYHMGEVIGKSREWVPSGGILALDMESVYHVWFLLENDKEWKKKKSFKINLKFCMLF